MKNNVFDTGKGRITQKFRSICEVHREIYDEIFLALYETDLLLLERLTVLLNESFGMGVRMDRKLTAGREPETESDLEPNDVATVETKRKMRNEISERILRKTL